MAGRKQGVERAVRAEKTLGVFSAPAPPSAAQIRQQQVRVRPFSDCRAPLLGICALPLPFLRTLCQRSLSWKPPPILPNSLCSLIFSPNFSPSDILFVYLHQINYKLHEGEVFGLLIHCCFSLPSV